MEFLGENGVAAPRLKDAGLPPPRMRQAYTGGDGVAGLAGMGGAHQVLPLAAHASGSALQGPSKPRPAPARPAPSCTEMLIMLRTLYQKCRLVHADLSGEGSPGARVCCCSSAVSANERGQAPGRRASAGAGAAARRPPVRTLDSALLRIDRPWTPAEYNVLVHNNELYCIDVSQAVELDHPRAFDFLREGGWVGERGGGVVVGGFMSGRRVPAVAAAVAAPAAAVVAAGSTTLAPPLPRPLLLLQTAST